MEKNLSKLNDVVQLFKDKYGEEEYYTRDLENKIVSWLNNTDKREIKNILIELFSDFKFYTKLEIKKILHKQLLCSLKKVDLDFTNILPLPSKDGRANSSYDMTMLLKEIVREEEIDIYRDTIKTDFIHIQKDIKSIIIFDDISGTGKTVIDFLKENFHIIKDKQVILNLITITENAKTNIDKHLKKNGILNVEIIAEHKYNKTFLKHAKLNGEHQKAIYEYEEEIWGKGNNNILGYKDSQVLIGFSHNIPNNTLSSFWYHTDFNGQKKEWNCLFKRHTQLKRGNVKSKRPKQNMKIKKAKGVAKN